MSGNSAHRNSGFYGLLSGPRFYLAVQKAVASRSARRRFVAEYVRPAAGQRILDVGCGPAEILTVLPEQVVYTGFDANPRYVEFARSRFGGRGTFLCGRAGEIADEELGGPFDRILFLALLHHLEDREVERLLTQAARLLAPGGTVVAFDPLTDVRQSPLARFLITRDRGARIRTRQDYLEMMRRHFAAVSGDVRNDLLRVPYTHLVARAGASAEALSRG